MPFGLRTQLGSRNHALNGDHDPSMGSGNFDGDGRPVVKYRNTVHVWR